LQRRLTNDSDRDAPRFYCQCDELKRQVEELQETMDAAQIPRQEYLKRAESAERQIEELRWLLEEALTELERANDISLPIGLKERIRAALGEEVQAMTIEHDQPAIPLEVQQFRTGSKGPDPIRGARSDLAFIFFYKGYIKGLCAAKDVFTGEDQ